MGDSRAPRPVPAEATPPRPGPFSVQGALTFPVYRPGGRLEPTAQRTMSTGYHSVVFGPTKTPHLGTVLEVNPIPGPRGECPKDCEACATGTADGEPILSRPDRPPSAGVVVTGAARRIIELSKAGEKVTTILVAGDHEPTMHPSFLEITENLRDLRNKWFNKSTLAVRITQPVMETRDVIHALQIYDRPLMRFAWGSARLFSSMTKGSADDYKRLIEVGTALDKLVVDACFVSTNSTEKELTSFQRKLEEIKPAEVLVGTVPPSSKSPKPLPDAKLEKIAATLAEKTGLSVKAYSADKQLA